jgi:hypothetical protein
MHGLFFLFIIVLIIGVYLYYPWIQLQLQKYILKTMRTTTVDLAKTHVEYNYEIKKEPFVLHEFIKRFVLYQLQPIIHWFQ